MEPRDYVKVNRDSNEDSQDCGQTLTGLNDVLAFQPVRECAAEKGETKEWDRKTGIHHTK